MSDHSVEAIRFLRLLWCDSANVIRAKAVHLPSLLTCAPELQVEDGTLFRMLEDLVWISQAQMALPVTADAVATAAGLGPVHDVRLVPAWKSLVELEHEPGVAHVVADMYDGEYPWTGCPRDFLRRMDQRAQRLGCEVMVGVELEFFLLKAESDGTPAPDTYDRTAYAQAESASVQRRVIDDIASALLAQGILVDGYNPESGPGQHELALRFGSPLETADRIVLARETIRSVARAHDLAATFMPVPFEDAAPSGMHLHVSISARDGALPLLDGPTGSFIEGVLGRLPALIAATAPTTNSHRRFRPHSWVGVYVIWGPGNKEAPVRVVLNKQDRPVRLEFKAADATANPYLATGCILAAGLAGVERGARLRPPVVVDPADLDETEREKLQAEPLPGAGKALDLFRADRLFADAMGETLFDAYTAVKAEEIEITSSWDVTTERNRLCNRY